jgi:uncharacterized protein YrrD
MEGRDATELMSMPVISMSEGKQLGKVKDVLFDPEQHALLGLMVTPSSAMDSTMLVAKERINAIGDAAITVSDAAALQEVASQERAREIIDSCIHLRGTSVVSETGNSLGTIDKILIDDSGNVAAYRASSGLLGFGSKTDITPAEVISVGEDAIVVAWSAEQTGTEGEAGSATTTRSPKGATRARTYDTLAESSDQTPRRHPDDTVPPTNTPL